MISSTVPLELINTIINELAGDMPALSACSLTSSSLREQAQKHLFCNIVLYLDAQDPSRADDLHEILYSNPHLASFVLSLKVHFSQPLGREFVIARHVALLSRFPRVRSVVLISESPLSGDNLWRIIQRNLKVALLALIQQSTVESLTLQGQDAFPAQILSLCWQLKDLTMRHCQLQGLKYQPRMSTEISRRSHSTQQGHLESLRLDAASGSEFLLMTLLQPSSSLSLSRLHILDISAVKPEHIQGLQKVLDVASSSLMQLSLNIKDTPSNSADPANPMISLRALTDLNTLILTCDASYHAGMTGHLLHTIASLPTACRGIETRIFIAVEPMLASPGKYPEEWRLLDTTLTAMLAAGVLGPLRVVIRTGYKIEDEGVTLQDLLRGLHAQGCLSI